MVEQSEHSRINRMIIEHTEHSDYNRILFILIHIQFCICAVVSPNLKPSFQNPWTHIHCCTTLHTGLIPRSPLDLSHSHEETMAVISPWL